jgi:hypothetical protein
MGRPRLIVPAKSEIKICAFNRTYLNLFTIEAMFSDEVIEYLHEILPYLEIKEDNVCGVIYKHTGRYNVRFPEAEKTKVSGNF